MRFLLGLFSRIPSAPLVKSRKLDWLVHRGGLATCHENSRIPSAPATTFIMGTVKDKPRSQTRSKITAPRTTHADISSKVDPPRLTQWNIFVGEIKENTTNEKRRQ